MKKRMKKVENSHEWITPEVESIMRMSKDQIIAAGFTKNKYDEVNARKPAKDAERGKELLEQRKELLSGFRKDGEDCGWYFGADSDYATLLDCLAYDPTDGDLDERISWPSIQVKMGGILPENIYGEVGLSDIAVDEEGYVEDERFVAWFEGWKQGIRMAYKNAEHCMRLAQFHPPTIEKSA
jgi:hypothetical protein